MADAHHAVASRQLRMLLDAGTVVGLSDGQLLDLFESRRDETAFTALMERHGPMVRRVCGDVLGNMLKINTKTVGMVSDFVGMVSDFVRLCSWFLRAVFETRNKV